MGYIKQSLRYLNILNTRWFWAGFLTGSAYFAWIFRWLWYLYPLDSLGIPNKTVSLILISLVFTFWVIITAVWWGIAGWLGHKFTKKNIFTPLIPLIFAGIFTLAEYVRAIFSSIFWYGHGGSIGPYWPMGNPAYLLIDIKPIASSASWWGIYGIDFCLVFFISSLILLIFQKRYFKIYILEIVVFTAVVMILEVSSAYFLNNAEKLPQIPVAIIQTKVPSTEFSTPEESLGDFQTKLRFLEKAAKEIKEGLILFPEGTDFFNNLARLLEGPDIQKYFENLSPKEVLVINGIRAKEGDTFKSRVLAISSKRGLVGFYDKQILTPGGEFLPYIVRIPLTIINPGLYQKFKDSREFSPGNNSNNIVYNDKSFNILICSEIKSPSMAGENNPDFIVTLASFSMWKGDLTASGQDMVNARFRAIENGKYVIVASNYGRSYIINPAGNIEKIASPNSYELLTGAIIPNKGRTWYNYVGDWPILLISSAFFAVGIRKIRNELKG